MVGTFADEVRVKAELKCFICAEDFVTENSLQTHLEVEHQVEEENHPLDVDNIFVKQEAGGEDFEVPNELEPTGTSASRPLTSCGTWEQSFVFDFSLKRHRQRFNSKPEVDLSCPDCPRVFKSPTSLHRHKVWQHSVISKLIGKAGAQTGSSQSKASDGTTKSTNSGNPKVDAGINKNLDQKEKLICEFCPTEKIFLNRNSLKRHESKFHRRSSKKAANTEAVVSTKGKMNSKDHIKEQTDLAQVPDSQSSSQHLGFDGRLAKSAKCPFCETRFDDLDVFRDHLRVSHKTEKNFVCSLCPVVNNIRKNFINHLKFHFGKMFACQICFKRFATKILLSLHTMASHLSSAEHPSDRGKTTSAGLDSKSSLKEKKLRKETKVTQSLMTHSQVEPLPGQAQGNLNPKSCRICDMNFASMGSLDRHNRTKHSTGKLNTTAGNSNPREVTVKREKEEFEPSVKEASCHICEKSFTRSNRLLLHIQKNHQGPETNKVDSSTEQTKIKNVGKNLLKGGTSKVPNKKPPLSKERLGPQASKGLAVGPKINACHLCGLIYSRSDRLNNHIKQKHFIEDLKPSIKTEVLNEEREMTPEDSTFCKICNKKYSRKDALKDHIKRKHNIRCKICGIKFVKKFTLEQHIKQFHQSEIKDQHDAELPTPAKRKFTTDLEETAEKKQKTDAPEQNSTSHSENHYRLGEDYRCRVCDQTYSNKSNLIRHEKSAHFKTREQLEKPVGEPERAPEGRKASPKSSKVAKRSSSKSTNLVNQLVENAQQVSGNESQHLGKQTQTTDRPNQPERKNGSDIKIKCPNCSQFTSSMRELISHMKTNH